MSLLCSKPKRRLGIDIASRSIKLLELSKTGQQYCVENYGFYVFNEPIVSGGLIRDKGQVADALRQIFESTKSSSKKAMLALPDACTLRKVLTVSRQLTPSDVNELAAIEVEKLLPHPEETLHFDFQWGNPLYEDARLCELFIIASQRLYIEARRDVLLCAGLSVSAIDVESQALYRVFALVSAKEHPTVIWVRLEDTSFDVYVFHHGVTIFAHTEAFEPSTTFVVTNQIKCVLQAFYASKPMYATDHMVLSVTKASHLESLDANQSDWSSSLSLDLGLDIISINPFEGMVIAKHLDREALLQNADHYLIACGLALRSGSCSK